MSRLSVRLRVEALLKQGGRTVRTLVLAAHTTDTNVRRILRDLRQEQKIHIGTWLRNTSGPHVAVWRWGNYKDAVRPEPYSNSEKSKRYRSALRAKFGEHYKEIHAAQKQSIPGRKILIDGRVAYQQ